MKLYIYCLRDKKLGSYEPPIFKNVDTEHFTEASARGLRLLSDEEKPRAKDMALYYLGEFDDTKGKFELLEHEEKLLDYEDYIDYGKESIEEPVRKS